VGGAERVGELIGHGDAPVALFELEACEGDLDGDVAVGEADGPRVALVDDRTEGLFGQTLDAACCREAIDNWTGRAGQRWGRAARGPDGIPFDDRKRLAMRRLTQSGSGSSASVPDHVEQDEDDGDGDAAGPESQPLALGPPVADLLDQAGNAHDGEPGAEEGEQGVGVLLELLVAGFDEV
jgi:hypothetical protein